MAARPVVWYLLTVVVVTVAADSIPTALPETIDPSRTPGFQPLRNCGLSAQRIGTLSSSEWKQELGTGDGCYRESVEEGQVTAAVASQLGNAESSGLAQQRRRAIGGLEAKLD